MFLWEQKKSNRAAASPAVELCEIVHADQVLADLGRAYSRAYLPEQFAIRSGVKKLLGRPCQNGEADRDPTWGQIMRERAKETRSVGDSSPSTLLRRSSPVGHLNRSSPNSIFLSCW